MIRIYDFDDIFNENSITYVFNMLRIIERHSPLSLVRYSSSGKGIHIQTQLDFKEIQCENRQKWSEYYGFDITWLIKHGKFVSEWITVGRFITKNQNRFFKVRNHGKETQISKVSKGKRGKNKSPIQT